MKRASALGNGAFYTSPFFVTLFEMIGGLVVTSGLQGPMLCLRFEGELPGTLFSLSTADADRTSGTSRAGKVDINNRVAVAIRFRTP